MSQISNDIREFIRGILSYLEVDLPLIYRNQDDGEFEARNRDFANKAECILAILEKNSMLSMIRNDGQCPDTLYLDMTKGRDQTPNEYVDITSPASNEGRQFNLDSNEATITLLQANESLDEGVNIDCPYGGLPAAHLVLKKSPKHGPLTRLGKRLFFDLTKKYYCGIVNEWLLCYGDGVNGMKPSFYILLTGVSIEHCGEGKRRDVTFQITINDDVNKKYIFQSQSEVDTKEWIHAIEAAKREDYSQIDSPSEKTKLSNHIRNISLPAIPVLEPSDKLYVNDEIVAEGIYEEPCPIYNNTHTTPPINISQTDQNSSVIEEEQPILPKKMGKSISKQKSVYDVPKPQLPPANITNDEKERAKNKIEFQTKIKDVHEKLSSQLSPTLSPEAGKPRKSISSPNKTDKTPTKSKTSVPSSEEAATPVKTNKPKKSISSPSKSPTKNKTAITSISEEPTTPVKNWFLNRLNRRSPGSSGRQTNSSNILGKHSFDEKDDECFNSQKSRHASESKVHSIMSHTTKTTPNKGGKVNMIINQLEANGHLPLFNKNIDRFSAGIQSDFSDDSNYEQINISHRIK